MNCYTYTKIVPVTKTLVTVITNSITNPAFVTWEPVDTLKIYFEEPLTTEEKALLDSIVAGYHYVSEIDRPKLLALIINSLGL